MTEIFPAVLWFLSHPQLNSIRVHLMTEGLLSRSGFFEGITYALMLGLADYNVVFAEYIQCKSCRF